MPWLTEANKSGKMEVIETVLEHVTKIGEDALSIQRLSGWLASRCSWGIAKTDR